MGKESEKRIDMLVCITESLCRTAEINKHCKSNILQFKKSGV